MNEPRVNIPEWTVSELSAALKRTVEDAYGFVRVRGEITGYRGPHDESPEPEASPSRPWIRWRPTATWAAAIAALMSVAMMNLSKVSEFLYFQF